MPQAFQAPAVMIEVTLYVAFLKVASQTSLIISRQQTGQKAKILEDIVRKVSKKVENPNKSPT